MVSYDRQADPLSPRSLALFLERIMDKIKNRESSGVNVHGSRVDMGVAEFKSARRWKNKSHSPPRRSSSESNLVFPIEVT